MDDSIYDSITGLRIGASLNDSKAKVYNQRVRHDMISIEAYKK